MTFARRIYTPPPKPPIRPATRQAAYPAPGAAIVTLPKHDYVRSPKLLAAVRTLPCQHTGTVGQTEAAHSNWAMGKGMGIKADDSRVAALCRSVHRDLDHGSKLTETQRKTLWWTAHCKTVRLLLARGLWPDDVPVPDIETRPF